LRRIATAVGWGCVRSVLIRREQVSVDLAGPVPGLEEVEGFDVRLDIDDGDFDMFSRGVREVFRGSGVEVQFA
jgi:hypothetical protein